MREEQQEGSLQPSPKQQAPLFVSCPGCHAVVAAGAKACKICGESLKELGTRKSAVVKKAKKRKRDEEGDSQYRERGVGTSGATGEDSSLDRGAMESSAASTSNDSKNASDSSQEAKDRHTVTDNAAVQPGEKLDCASFDCSKKGYTNPMVEIKAGLNVWHQVRVYKETANELCVSYPGKDNRARKEWLKRTSSRFWRGPMAQRFWVCTDKNLGRWRPKAAEEAEKSRRGGKRRSAPGQKAARVRRPSAGHGETTEGTGTHTGASMGPYSGAEDEDPDSPKQASSGQAPQDRAEASSKPPLQEAGSSEPPLLQPQGMGQGKPEQQQAGPWRRDAEPAIHSNSEEQAHEVEHTMVELEPGAALAAWFKVHYAELDNRGQLFTHLEGAGPEIGVQQKQESALEGVSPRQRREYDVGQGKSVRGMPGDASTAQLEEGDWQPPNVQRPAHGVANNGAVLDKSPPDPPRSQHPHGASTAQQAACLDASKQRKQLVNRLALQTGPEHSAAERVVPGPGRQSLKGRTDKSSAPSRQEMQLQRMNGAANPGQMPGLPGKATSQGLPGKAPRKDSATARHRQDTAAGKESSKPKPAGQPPLARPGALLGKDGVTKGWRKGSAKQPAKARAAPGHPAGPSAGRPPNDAAQGKRDAPPKAPQQRPPMVTLEPTDLFL